MGLCGRVTASRDPHWAGPAAWLELQGDLDKPERCAPLGGSHTPLEASCLPRPLDCSRVSPVARARSSRTQAVGLSAPPF